MALELPGYGRSSGATFVSKYWSEQDADLFLRVLDTLSGPAEKKLQVRRRDNRVDTSGFFRHFSQTIAFTICRVVSLCLRKGLGQQHFSELMLRSFPGLETHRAQERALTVPMPLLACMCNDNPRFRDCIFAVENNRKNM